MNPAQLRTVSGDEARNLLEEQISKHNGGLLSTLAVYDASETVRVGHDTIRAMEEFINVPFFGLDDEALIAWLLAIPLDERFFRNPASVKNVAAAHLLKLSLDAVRHFVISRFPVVTTEDRIVCYNRIGTLASLVGGPDQPRRACR
jgi:hypothetical protein